MASLCSPVSHKGFSEADLRVDRMKTLMQTTLDNLPRLEDQRPILNPNE